MEPSLPRGTRDYGPEATIYLKDIIANVEATYKAFGFSPIDTPAIENLETLSAKAYGQESSGEIYRIEGGKEALRFDLSVPLARFMAMNKDLQMPFKRYHIGKVWRMDEPQRMRFREFIQADIDIIGSSEPLAEAECIAANAAAIESLGISSYEVLINSRILLNAILTKFSFPEQAHGQVIRLIDKLDKIGMDGVSSEIKKLGVDAKQCEMMLEFITQEHSSSSELIEKLVNNIDGVKEEASRITKILGLLEKYAIKGTASLDFSLARGLDYYTSTVWEFVIYEKGRKLPTVAGGGRYDNLIGIFANRKVPAVGSSVGISRVFDLYFKDRVKRSYAEVYVATIGAEVTDYAINAAKDLRKSGILVDMNITSRNISKQLEHASALKIPYVAIIGKEEVSKSSLKLRNMETGSEEMLKIDEAADRIKKIK